MRFYLAARYSRREQMLLAQDDLARLGHTVSSRWIQGNHQVDEAGMSTEAGREYRERFAAEDYADVIAAGCVINFTEKPRSCNSRGGRHVEFGMAIGMGKTCLIVGPLENVFHCLRLSNIHHFDAWPGALEFIAGTR
jgi:hypothetical protein